MRLLKEGQQRVQKLMSERVQHSDRHSLRRLIPRKMPSLQQLQYIDLFLENWEKNIIGGAALIACIAFLGIGWTLWKQHTVPVPAQGGDLQEILVGAPRFINPLFAISDTDRALTSLMYLPLCDVQNAGVPHLADSCDISDNKRAVITLGSHTWHDDQPVTNDDVLYTIQEMQDKTVGSPWRDLATHFTLGTDTAGHLIISAKQSTSGLSTLLSSSILPQHVWKDVDAAHMRTDALNLHPIGSGPYKLEHTVTDNDGLVQSIVMQAVPDFKPHRAYIDELTFRFADDDLTARELFRTRQVDSMFLFDPTDTAELVKRDVKRYEFTSPTVVSLFFNPSANSIFRKAEVRDAFSYALNRSKLVKDALQGNGVPARSPFPLSMLRDPAQTEPEFDAAHAMDLFKKSLGATASTTLVLGVPNVPSYQSAAYEIKDQLKPYNIVVSVSVIDSLDVGANLLSYDMILLGQDYGAAGNAYPYWHSTASGADGANYARYQIREVDSWLEQLQAEPRPDMRDKLLAKINARLIADTPAIFLYQPIYQYYVAGKVQGVTFPANSDPAERFAQSFEWYTNTSRTHK